MAREVQEETGLDIGDARREARLHALSTAEGTVIFRRYFLDQDADELGNRIVDFVKLDPVAEVTEPVIIRGMDDLPDGLMAHMRPLLRWHFEGTE